MSRRRTRVVYVPPDYPGRAAFVPGATFDPATLSLTAWWRANYAGLPWVGTASAGNSGTGGTHDLSSAAGTPTAGAAQNGFTPADFDGSQRFDGSVLSSYITAAAGTIVVLFIADTAAAAAGAPINNPGMVAEGSGYLNLGFSDAGVTAAFNDGAPKSITAAAAVSSYHLAKMVWNGATLAMAVDSNPTLPTAIACGSLGSVGPSLRIGKGIAATQFDGRILEIMMSDTALSDATFDGIRSYMNTRYALAL